MVNGDNDLQHLADCHREELLLLLSLLLKPLNRSHREEDLDSVQEKNLLIESSMEWLLQTVVSFLSLDVTSNAGEQTNCSSVLQKESKHHIQTSLRFLHKLMIYYFVTPFSKRVGNLC